MPRYWSLDHVSGQLTDKRNRTRTSYYRGRILDKMALLTGQPTVVDKLQKTIRLQTSVGGAQKIMDFDGAQALL